MRNIFLRLTVVLLITAVIIVPTISVFPPADNPIWIEASGMAVIALFLIILLVRLRYLFSKKDGSIILSLGLCVCLVSVIAEALNALFDAANWFEIVHGIASPIGIGLSFTGFFLLLRDQQRIQRGLEENKASFEKLSITDELTGLFNSRHFYEQLEAEMKRSRRYQRELSILLIDIDDFKKHNDSFGHIEGDRVLRKLGRLITSVLREYDTGYRYGGEEFTVVLPETSQEHAKVVAERIRSDFKATEFEPDGNMVTKTLSAGVARYTSEDDISTFIKRADRAMYLAKQRGKDQIAFFDDSNGESS